MCQDSQGISSRLDFSLTGPRYLSSARGPGLTDWLGITTGATRDGLEERRLEEKIRVVGRWWVTSARQEQGCWLGITAGTTEERLELKEKDEGEDLAERS